MTATEILIAKRVLGWIRENLACYIVVALNEARVKNPKLLYTEEWLAGITYRETGFLIDRYVTQKVKPEVIHTLMRGDYSKRPKDTEKKFHGYGYAQIDVDSFPDFVKSGDWKDPLKVYRFAISVLEGKRTYIANHIIIKEHSIDDLHRIITAAYNCGEGNIVKVVKRKLDIDAYTHQKNYSKMVWEYRKIYQTLL